MAQLTLGQAATVCGRNKTTIMRAIKSGLLSAQRDDFGHYQIDPAELHRVYPKPETQLALSAEKQRDATENATLKEVYEARLQALKDILAVKEEQIEGLKEERNEWRRQATRLLPAPIEAAMSEQAVQAEAKKQKGWLAGLLARSG